MAKLELDGLTKRFGETAALDDVDLAVEDGEVMAILGPSGCGKSTLLRVTAGLEVPEAGAVRWDGVDVTTVPVHRRPFGLMFQGFALFPHKTVGQNVAFGLRMQGAERSQIAERVRQALEWVGMAGYAPRRIEGLSGGEQQRVALARTLAPEPGLVMLDEPLGSLDRNLRERLVGEIRDILAERDTTALYVTHDHGEAAFIGDRMSIMRAGRIVQTGTLDEIRDRPVDDWTADFVREAPPERS